jgi:hypothetical protein
MPRPKNAVPTVLIKAWVPPELKGKLYLTLISDLEGRIPQGKISSFICDRLREFFGWKTLDLSPYGFQPGYFIKGPSEMIEAVQRRLAERLL